jgi:signal transduction histidine kinase
VVHLWVHDSGAGVPAADAERIFERFVKGDRSAGSGLGLSIVAAIAKAHGGYARADPDSGRGTRFEIVVPSQGAKRGGVTTSLPTP